MCNVTQYLKQKVKDVLKKRGYVLLPNNCLNSSNHQIVKSLEYLKVDSIIDIGANVGQFAMGMIREGFKGKIISFEPLKSASESLRKNALNYPNWIINPPMALGDFTGEIEINVCSRSSCSSILPMLKSHQNALPKAKTTHKENIAIQTLDEAIKPYAKIINNYLIKIDTQGYELPVLVGSENCLKNATAVLCEMSLIPLFEKQTLWKELVKYLESKGFKIWAIQKAFINEAQGQDLQLNVLMAKNNKE